MTIGFATKQSYYSTKVECDGYSRVSSLAGTRSWQYTPLQCQISRACCEARRTKCKIICQQTYKIILSDGWAQAPDLGHLIMRQCSTKSHYMCLGTEECPTKLTWWRQAKHWGSHHGSSKTRPRCTCFSLWDLPYNLWPKMQTVHANKEMVPPLLSGCRELAVADYT